MSELLPQRVLMTVDTVGEVWTYALDLARAFAAQGIEVALAAMGEPLSDSQRQAVDRIPRLRVFESGFRLESLKEAARDVERASEWLLRLEHRIGPDVIHLNSPVHAALPWSAPKLIVAHACRLSRWSAVQSEPLPESWDDYRREVQAGLAAADLIIAPSRAALAALAEHCGPLPCSRIIPHGRDPQLFKPAAKEEMIFASGRLTDEAKNLKTLEKIAPDLPWPIYLAGESQHAGEAGAHGTRLLGHLSPRALAAWLGRSAIYALPARYEPLGLPALEAALAGCALVLGDIPSLRETWRNRAIFVPPDDTAAWRNALLALTVEPEKRQSLAAAARARALELTLERMVTAYLAAYGDLLARPGVPEEDLEVAAFDLPQAATPAAF